MSLELVFRGDHLLFRCTTVSIRLYAMVGDGVVENTFFAVLITFILVSYDGSRFDSRE